MSRRYDMCLSVKRFKSAQDLVKVESLFSSLWGCDYSSQARSTDDGLCLDIGAENYLCGGESEEEFATRVSEAVWEELGYFVEVTIQATYLEEIPFEVHICEEDDYEYWLDSLKEASGD